MASIRNRTLTDGTRAYIAQIVIKRKGQIVHRESKSFPKKSAAIAWGRRRETELAEPGAVGLLQTKDITLADAIDRYMATSKQDMHKVRRSVLTRCKASSIGSLPCRAITSADIMAYATELGRTMKPQSVQSHMSRLSPVFAIAKTAWGYDLDYEAMRDAMRAARRLGMTDKSTERTRRPTLDELDKLISYFEAGYAPGNTPMHKLVGFALFSTRRQSEITRLRWADLEVEHKRIMVRNMKNPGQIRDNHVWCDLPEEALRIIDSMPRTSEYIFPYNAKTVSVMFSRACVVVGIDDLHFHDLRHEGVSRLFEMGLNIPHVAAVSGHRSWSSLRRYTHIRQRGDKYAGWPTLGRLT